MSDLPGYGQTGSDQPGYGLPGYGQPGYGPSLPPVSGGWGAPAPRPGGVPLRPLGVGETLSGAFTRIRRNPGATLGLAAIIETISGIITAALSWSEQKLTHQLQQSLKGTPTSAQAGHALGHFSASFLPYFFVTIALTFVVQQILTGMLTGALGRGLIGHQITIRQARRVY